MTAGVGFPIERVSLVASSMVTSWIVPALIFVIVVVACVAGLRWIRTEHVDTLAAVPLFSGLPRKRLMSVLGSTNAVEFPSGTTIVEEGTRGGGFFLITEGAARVTVGGAERARLSPGAYFGDVAVIDGGPRSATITAETHVATLELTPSAFKALIQKEPSIERAISAELRRRLGTSGKQDDTATLEQLCQELRQAEQPGWGQAEPIQRRGIKRLFASRA